MSPLGPFPGFFDSKKCVETDRDDTPGDRKRTRMTRLGSPGVSSRSVSGFVCQTNLEMDGEPLSLQAQLNSFLFPKHRWIRLEKSVRSFR